MDTKAYTSVPQELSHQAPYQFFSYISFLF